MMISDMAQPASPPPSSGSDWMITEVGALTGVGELTGVGDLTGVGGLKTAGIMTSGVKTSSRISCTQSSYFPF